MLALEFPPISHLIEWPELAFGINKAVLIWWGAAIVTLAFFFVAGSKKKMVPNGIQALAESSVDFIREQVILQTIGADGMKYLPLLLCMFFFIFFSNITEVIPGIQFPANSRMAMPAALAIMVWFIFNIVGVRSQGAFNYVKNVMIPPGVPKFLLPLVALIEFVSTFLVRPFSLAVRLFANMLAGHLILVTFAIICAALATWSITLVILPFSFALLVALTGFEVLVSFLQAFIFTILTAVYIGGAMHPEH